MALHVARGTLGPWCAGEAVSRSRRLRVYGTTSFRSACPPAPNGSRQTREIIAAHSKVEAKRLAGWRIGLSEIGETGNEEEVALATGEPGTVFWSPLDARPPAWRSVTTSVEVKP